MAKQAIHNGWKLLLTFLLGAVFAFLAFGLAQSVSNENLEGSVLHTFSIEDGSYDSDDYDSGSWPCMGTSQSECESESGCAWVDNFCGSTDYHYGGSDSGGGFYCYTVGSEDECTSNGCVWYTDYSDVPYCDDEAHGRAMEEVRSDDGYHDGGYVMDSDCMWMNRDNECVKEGEWDFDHSGRECMATDTTWECKGEDGEYYDDGSCYEWPDKSSCENDGCIWQDTYCSDFAHDPGSSSDPDCAWMNRDNQCVKEGDWDMADSGRECRVEHGDWDCRDVDSDSTGTTTPDDDDHSTGTTEDCAWWDDAGKCMQLHEWGYSNGFWCMRPAPTEIECDRDHHEEEDEDDFEDEEDDGFDDEDEHEEDDYPRYGSGEQDTVDWNRREIKNRRRELKRNFRDMDLDLSNLERLVNQWEAAVDEMEDALEKRDLSTFNNMQRDASSLMEKVNEEFADAHNASSMFHAHNMVEEKEDQIRDIERKLKSMRKDMERDGGDDSSSLNKFEGYLDEMRDIVEKIEQKVSSLDSTNNEEMRQDILEDIWDLGEDFNDLSMDFWDESNEVDEEMHRDHRLKDTDRNLRDMERSLKDISREAERIERDAPEKAGDVENIKDMINKMEGLLDEIKDAFEDEDVDTLDDLNHDFWDLNTDAWYIIQDLHEYEHHEHEGDEMERILEERGRHLKNAERECGRVECSSDMQDVLGKMKVLFEEMRQVAERGEDFETFWDLEWELGDKEHMFWDMMGDAHDVHNRERETEDMGRWLRDTARELKDRDGWVSDLEREANKGHIPAAQVEKLRGIHSEMVAVAQKAQAAFDEKDFETARDLLDHELEDLRRDFEDITDAFEEVFEEEFFEREIEFMVKELKMAQQEIFDLMAIDALSPEKGDLCLGYIDQGFALVEELEAARASGNVSDELKVRFDDLGEQAEADCDFFDEPNHEGFRDVYIDDEHHDRYEDVVVDRISKEVAKRVLDELTEGNTTLVNNLLGESDGHEDEVARVLEAMTFAPEEFHDDLLSRKAAMLEEIKELEALTARLQRAKKLAMTELQEFQRIQSQIAGHNFVGEAGTTMEEKIEEFLEAADDLSEDQIKVEIARLEREAERAITQDINEKFEKGVIPFKDMDDSHWGTKYVANLKSEGIVGGKTHDTFDPEDSVRINEMLKMSFESMDIGPARANPRLAGADQDWSKGYVRHAEDRDLEIMKKLHSANDLGTPATRADVIRMVLEARGVTPDASYLADVERFGDVNENHPDYLYIMEGRRLGLINGDAGLNTFRPDDGINRVEAAKIVDESQKVEEVQ